jgi:phage gp29-like protein
MPTRTRKHRHPAAAPAEVPRETLARGLDAARGDLEAIVGLIDDEEARDAMMTTMARYVGALVALDRYDRPARPANYKAGLRALMRGA